MAGKTARELIEDEVHRATREASLSADAVRDQAEADASALKGVLMILKAIKESRLRTIEEADAMIARHPRDIEWPAIRDGALKSLEMLERLGAGPDHDEMAEAQAALADAHMAMGASADDAREQAWSLRERLALTGMGPGAIAQRLRIEAGAREAR